MMKFRNVSRKNTSTNFKRRVVHLDKSLKFALSATGNKTFQAKKINRFYKSDSHLLKSTKYKAVLSTSHGSVPVQKSEKPTMFQQRREIHTTVIDPSNPISSSVASNGIIIPHFEKMKSPRVYMKMAGKVQQDHGLDLSNMTFIMAADRLLDEKTRGVMKEMIREKSPGRLLVVRGSSSLAHEDNTKVTVAFEDLAKFAIDTKGIELACVMDQYTRCKDFEDNYRYKTEELGASWMFSQPAYSPSSTQPDFLKNLEFAFKDSGVMPVVSIVPKFERFSDYVVQRVGDPSKYQLASGVWIDLQQGDYKPGETMNWVFERAISGNADRDPKDMFQTRLGMRVTEDHLVPIFDIAQGLGAANPIPKDRVIEDTAAPQAETSTPEPEDA